MSDDLARRYEAMLREYLSAGSEEALERAYALGREAVDTGLGVLGLADAHEEALARISTGADDTVRASLIRAAKPFFFECLAPLEMSLRGYREANAKLHQVNAELTRANLAADAANAELRAFSASVAHDLRAPLNTIDGFGRIILDDHAAALDAEGRRMLDRMIAGAGHMRDLIDGLLVLARVSQADLVVTEVDLSAIAHELITARAPRQSERPLQAVVAPGLRARGDPRMLRQVLENLLDNALKFSSKKEAPHIEFGVADGAFFVRDNGAGFDMKHASKLFAPFSRLHSQREFPGTGIGLGTVQRIVRRHGGKLWAESKPEAGATFYFTLAFGDANPEARQ